MPNDLAMFKECGFKSLEQYVRSDPRGRSYGYFKATVACTATPAIEVSKFDSTGDRVWTATFVGWSNFNRWAKEL